MFSHSNLTNYLVKHCKSFPNKNGIIVGALDDFFINKISLEFPLFKYYGKSIDNSEFNKMIKSNTFVIFYSYKPEYFDKITNCVCNVDYIYIDHEPIILTNFSGTYTDIFNNNVKGCFSGKIFIKGNDNCIISQSKCIDCFFDVSNKSVIDIDANCNIDTCKFTLHDDGQLVIKDRCSVNASIIKIYIGSIIQLGSNTTIGNNCYIQNKSRSSHVTIGDDCYFFNNVHILCGNEFDTYILYEKQLPIISNGIIIENHVLVESNVNIIDGSHISEGTIVKTGSTTNSLYPNNCIVSGNPALITQKNISWSRSDDVYDSKKCGGYMIPTNDSWSGDEESKIKWMEDHLDISPCAYNCYRYYLKKNASRDILLKYLEIASNIEGDWVTIEYINLLSQGDESDKNIAFEKCNLLFNNSIIERVKVECSIMLSKYYYTGLGTKQDLDKALDIITFANDRHHVWSYVLSADYCVSKNLYEKAQILYLKALSEGSYNKDVCSGIVVKLLSSIMSSDPYIDVISKIDIFINKCTISKQVADVLYKVFYRFYPSKINLLIDKLLLIPNRTPVIENLISSLLLISGDIKKYQDIYNTFINKNEEVTSLFDALEAFNSLGGCNLIFDDTDTSGAVIYNLNHLCFLTQLIQIRSINHPKQKAILVANNIFHKEKLYRDLIKFGIFDILIEFNGRIAYHNNSYSSVINTIDDYYSKLLDQINMPIAAIYTGCDISNSFGVFAIKNGYKVHVIEAEPHQIEHDYREFGGFNLKFYTKEYSDVQRASGIIRGLSPLCYRLKHWYVGCPSVNVECETYIDFDKNLHNISSSTKQSLLEMLPISKSDIADITLVLTNSSGFLSTNTDLKYPVYFGLYQLMIDFFTSGDNVYIKSHPSDDYPDFDKYFSGIKILDNSYPIELYTLLPNFHIKQLISGFTTGSLKINKYVDNNTVCGMGFYKHSNHLLQLYSVYLISNKFKLQLVSEDPFIQDFINNCIQTDKLDNISVCDVSFSENHSSSSFCFTDSVDSIKIRVKVTPDSDSLFEESIKIISFKSNNVELLSKLSSIKISKKLKQSKIKLTIQTINGLNKRESNGL